MARPRPGGMGWECDLPDIRDRHSLSEGRRRRCLPAHHDEDNGAVRYFGRILVALGFGVAACVSGCAATGDAERYEALLNPPGIHESSKSDSDAARAGQIPVSQYYAALKAAQDKAKGSAEIDAFIDKGIGLVGAYCLRWFHRLDAVQRNVDLRERDFNVIRQLGTALLGIGKANSDWVTFYGAANTAYSGILENFNEAVLTGPTTAKVKVQVLGMLQQSEARLRSDASKLTFTQAYTRIELHADTCTYGTIRSLLDSTLASTKSKRDPETGKITSDRVESSYEFDDASSKLHEFWQPNGQVSQANQAALAAWMAKNQLANVSITLLVNGHLFSAARAKAVKDLGL